MSSFAGSAREILISKASVLHQVRVEHCETVKVVSEPPVSPVVATETNTSPIAVEHMTIAEEEAVKESDTDDNKDSGSKNSVTKDSDSVDKCKDSASKGRGEKVEEDEEEEDEVSKKDSDSDSSSSDDSSSEEQDDDEEEVEVLCEASMLQETLTTPDIAYLEAVDSEDEDSNDVKLEITEEDVKGGQGSGKEDNNEEDDTNIGQTV